MSAPGFPEACASLVNVMADIATVFDLIHDQLLEIHNAHTQPDAVRMHAADALAQIDEGRRLLFLEPEGNVE